MADFTSAQDSLAAARAARDAAEAAAAQAAARQQTLAAALARGPAQRRAAGWRHGAARDDRQTGCR